MGCTVSLTKSPVRQTAKSDSKQPDTNDDHTKTNQDFKLIGSRTLTNTAQNNSTHNRLKNETEIAENGDDISTNKSLTILHFNDVYNIEPRDKEPIGGAARFAHKLASYKHLNPLTAFSGDVLNPSMMSSVTKGKHMIPVLNSLNIKIAVFGNHDFDFGVDDLIDFKEATDFPWLMSNVVDKITNEPLANGEITKMIEWHGKKIGFVGLVEEEWLATLATIDPSDLIFQDYVNRGTELALQLREEGADFVIALTHMRMPNDTRLAHSSSGIDLILGGHDHHYEVKEVNGIKIIKSGSDFREFSKITIDFGDDNNYAVDVERIEITGDIPEDPHLKEIVDKYMDIMEESMEETLGIIEVELDGRFASLRTQETNLGNFVVDIMHNVTKADVVLLNSGTLRSDAIHPPGIFKKKDLVAILPMPDAVVVIEITGEQLLKALENGVSQWPKHEGRFPQISGMKFAFNPDLVPGSRVLRESVIIGEEILNSNKLYKLCTKSYLAKGKDGYDVFAEGKVLLNEEDGPILPTIVQNHFDSINIVKGVKLSKSKHRQTIIMRQPGDSSASLLDEEKHHVKINPVAEGRIKNIKELSETNQSKAVEITSLEHINSDLTEQVLHHAKNEAAMADHDDSDKHEKPEINELNNAELERNKPSIDSKNSPTDLATEDDYWDLWEAVKTDDIQTVSIVF